jgi:5,10-methylenetetrahydromethanopterin reductase
MKISAAFPPVPATPEHIVLAEKLGYSTAWVYDTPALQPARAAFASGPAS